MLVLGRASAVQRHTLFSAKDGTGKTDTVGWEVADREEIGTTAPTPAMRSRGPIMRWGETRVMALGPYTTLTTLDGKRDVHGWAGTFGQGTGFSRIIDGNIDVDGGLEPSTRRQLE